MRHTLRIFILLSGINIALALPVSAAGGRLTVNSDLLTHDTATDTYTAEGKVKLESGATTLYADRALLKESEGTAEAWGNVRVLKGDDILTGDRLIMDLATNAGKVGNARLFQKKANFHLIADEIYRLGPDNYYVARGSFTTCDGDPPSWKFTASDLNVTMEGYAAGTNSIFYIRDVPVFYSPFILFPTKKERQTGFLTPRAGSSSKKGFSLNVPFYWAISASQDATAELDIQTKRGAGTALNYRYIRRRGSEGDFTGYLFYDTNRERFRGNINQKHLEIVSPSFSFKSDIHLATDRDFFRDFGEISGDYNRQKLDSRVSFAKNWSLLSLGTEFNYIQDLDAPNNRATLQRLPTVTVTGIRQRLGQMPLFLSYDGIFDHFYRDEGMRGVRGNIRPALTLNQNLFRNFDLTVFGGYRARLYETQQGGDFNGYHGDLLPDMGASLSTTVSRVFNAGIGSLAKVRHQLVPEVSYGYVPEKNQERLPNYDFNDRIVAQNMVTYSLASYLTGRFQSGEAPPAYRELLYLKVTQGYDIRESRRDLLTLVDERRPFTDVRLEARVSPHQQATLSMDSRYNPYEGRFSLLNLNVDIATPDNKNFAGVGYRFARNEVEYMEGRLGFALVKPFVFHYTARYSFDKRDFLESLYTLEYKHQCWSVLFSYRERLDNSTLLKNREFLVTFTLYGIGPLNSFRVL